MWVLNMSRNLHLALELMEFTGIMVKSYLDTSTLEDNISTIILRIFRGNLVK